MSMTTSTKWSEEDLERLSALIKARLPRAQIAAQLGRTVSSVTQAITKHGLSSQVAVKWSDAERSTLRRMRAEGRTAREIGQALGRHLESVAGMLSYLKLGRCPIATPAEGELWKAIPAFPGYEISSHGRVRNGKTLRDMRLGSDGSGYSQVMLPTPQGRKTLKVHRSVLEVFGTAPSDPAAQIVNHIDGNKKNARIENLEWVTHRQNTQHAVRTGLHRGGREPGHARNPGRNIQTFVPISGFETEEWAAIPCNPDYEVSTLGRVRNARTNRILHQSTDGSGYPHISIPTSTGRKTLKIHRLLAEIFKPSSDPLAIIVNHIDGNKQNARLENLEWVTPQENAEHAVRTGLHQSQHGEHHVNAKYSNSQIRTICELIQNKWDDVAIRDSLEFDVNLLTIRQIKRRQTWRSVSKDYVW